MINTSETPEPVDVKYIDPEDDQKENCSHLIGLVKTLN
jgi:hypothetical protein